MSIAVNLAHIIRTKGLSVAETADACQVSPTSVYMWVKGKTLPRQDSLGQLVEGLGCTLYDLTGPLPVERYPLPYTAERAKLASIKLQESMQTDVNPDFDAPLEDKLASIKAIFPDTDMSVVNQSRAASNCKQGRRMLRIKERRTAPSIELQARLEVKQQLVDLFNQAVELAPPSEVFAVFGQMVYKNLIK